MKISELRALTRIWDLAVLDTGAKGLTYTPEAIYFDGLHVSATVVLPEPLIEKVEEPMFVYGKTFQATLSLLGDEESVTLRALPEKGEVLMVSGHTKAHVQAAPGSPFIGRKSERAVTIQVGKERLIKALQFVMEVTARDMVNPTLTGVQGEYRDGKLVLRATNGHSRAAVTWVPAKSKATRPFAFVIVPADLHVSLNCLADPIIRLVVSEGTVIVKDSVTTIGLGTLELSKFPDLGVMPRKFTKEVTLPTKALSLIARAADTFDTDRLAVLTIKKGKVTLSAAGEERGMFEAVVSSTSGKELDETLTFDSGLLAIATHLGVKVKIQFNGSTSPVMMTGDPGKFYWLSPVIVH